MENGLLLLALVFAVGDWVATWQGWDRIRWLTKPGALLLLILWFSQVGGWRGPLLWFGLGLVFSLLGDILLLLPGRFFLGGVGAFLLAHLAYITGFLQQLSPLSWLVILPALLVGAAFWILNGKIRAGIRARGENGLLIPVMVYALILSLMWLSALTTLLRPDWSGALALLASLGAGLFFLSDALLAYNRFVRPLFAGNLLVMTSYHIGQFLIAAAVLARYAV